MWSTEDASKECALLNYVPKIAIVTITSATDKFLKARHDANLTISPNQP
jgi:hypothetical protein